MIAALVSTRGALPLRAVVVRATVVGVTAEVEVEQTFENTYDEVLEVSYVFPLPDLAAVTRCELRTGGRAIVAKLEERGAARARYAAAIEEGKQAALAEQDRPNVFTVTLGNVAPGERAAVRFGMAYVLPREDGRHVLRLPLVVGERYVPGVAIGGEDVGAGIERDTTEVPDASRVSPPRLAEDAERPALSIEVALVHPALDEIASNLRIVVEPHGAGTIVRVAPGQRLDRDFVLRFRIGDEAVRTQLAVCGGTFQLTLVPPLAKLRTRPRDLVLLLDRSGSMEGWKIVAARRALARMIDVLDDTDRFAVYAFGSDTVACADLAADRLHAASAANRARAGEMLAGMTATGGTEMLQPLELATGLLAGADDGRDRWIVLVTDGQVANDDALVRLVKGGGAKVLALGIDDAVNSSLLQRLASATGGRVELVQQESELEDALDRLHVLIATPVIERVTIEGEGIAGGTLAPCGPLNVFPGVPLVVRGRHDGALAAVHVRGRMGREPFEQSVRAEHVDAPALHACWAREHLLALEDRFVTSRGDERSTLVNDMIATSLQFGVLCRFTAFVAVDEHGPRRAVATRHVQQPVEPAHPVEPHAPFASRSQIATTRWGGRSGADAQVRTQTGILRGKFSHLSPEQAMGKVIGPRHEVFGLAHLLAELLLGRRLFHGTNDLDTLKQIVDAVLPAPFVSPPALAAVLRRALDRDPDARFATPGALADALAASHAVASRDEVARWLAALAPKELAVQAAWLARAASARAPAGGYFAIAHLAVAGECILTFAVRDGHEPVALRRLYPHYAEDPDFVEAFLSTAAVSIDGLAHVVDAGADTHGGIFLATTFVHGLELGRITRLAPTMPTPIALAIIIDAARALHAALVLPGPTPAGLLVRDLSPSALRVSFTGQPVWTSLGIAPSPEHAVSRRSAVELAVARDVSLSPRAVAVIPPHESRFVVVPRTASPAPPRSPRRWLRWWRE